MLERICRSCGRTFPQFNPLYTKCPKCTKKLVQKKPLNKFGKQARLNRQDRKQWIADNPPDAFGYWECYLKISPLCYRRVRASDLNVEHVESKTRRPDLRHDQSNMRAACPPCNQMKNSKSASEFGVM